MAKSTKRNKSTERQRERIGAYLALILYMLTQGNLGFVELDWLTPSMC